MSKRKNMVVRTTKSTI